MEFFQFLLRGPEKHIVGKEVPAGGLVDYPYVVTVTRVGTNITIANEEFGRPVEPGCNGSKDAMKMGWIDRLVKVVPVDGTIGDLVSYDVPVFRAATGEGACPDNECTGIAQHRFLPPNAMPGEFGRWELVVDGIGDTQTETAKTVRRESNDRH
jgi:hypothetical protein